MPTQAEDNKRIVLDFHNAVFNRYELDVLEECIAEDFIEHAAKIEDGRASLRRYCQELALVKPNRSNRIVRVIADDEYVVLHGHVKDPDAGKEFAAVDIFRMQGGMIAEHWEVVEPIGTGVNAQPVL